MKIDTRLQIRTTRFGCVLWAQNWWLVGAEKNQKYLQICEDMRRHIFDGQSCVNDIVQSCDLLKIFELIATDEIVDHIVTL